MNQSILNLYKMVDISNELKLIGNCISILASDVSLMNDRFIMNNLSSIEPILNNQEYITKKIIVISMIGVVRTGKSLLLNYILRHVILKLGETTQQHLDIPLEGFAWYHGLDMVTKGLQLWSQPLIVKFGKEEVIVLLLDAQGIFSKMHSMNEDIRIGSTALLLSSTLIVNVHKEIDESVCSYLQLITNFTKMNLKITYFRKPFQNLIFVVRDWQSSSIYSFGFEGGLRYLKQISKRSRYSNTPLINLSYFETMFDNVCCCLLPHPGEKAVFNTMFDGRLYDLDVQFLEHLKRFLSGIFSREFVEFKSINDGYLSCKDLMQYANAFGACINDVSVGNCDNVLLENAYVKMWENVECMSNFYISNMDKFLLENDNLNNKRFLDEHSQLERRAMDRWFKSPTVAAIGKKLIKKEMFTIMDNKLNSLLKRYQDDNKYKNLNMGLHTPFALLALSMLTFVVYQLFYLLTNFTSIIHAALNTWFCSVLLLFVWLAAILWEIDELIGIMDEIADLLIKYLYHPFNILLRSKQTRALERFFMDTKLAL